MKSIPVGHYIQTYRAKWPGATKQNRLDGAAHELDKLAAIGVVGVVYHGFSTELVPENFAVLAKLARDRGLVPLAAYGMDSDNPEEKAKRIAKVAVMPECAGVVLDAEGAWEDSTDDKAKAKAFGTAYRALAPDVWTCDQPWWKPTVHWSRFPWEEFAEICDARAPQVYCNNYRGQWGKDAYEKTFAGYEAAWLKLETRLGQLTRRRFPTIQGYHWDSADIETCLAVEPMLIIWCEAWPDDGVMAALRTNHQKRCAVPT